MAIFLTLWFVPTTHRICAYIDYQVYAALNQSLLHSHAWQLFWGYLNHPNETWLNIIFMAGINILGVSTLPKAQRKRAIIIVMYCWLSFQIVLYLTHKIFCDWIEIQRNSPSIMIEPWVILSETLQIPNIKVYSHSSFPAGHILVLIYWSKFIDMYSKVNVRLIAYATVLILTMPRMISGAHWLSDVVFTIIYAMLWFQLFTLPPLLNKANQYGAALLNMFSKKQLQPASGDV